MKGKPTLEPTDRDEASRNEIEEVLRQIMLLPSSNLLQSQNREPTKAELEQRYKLTKKK